jgi:HTH-type transcriptional regulator, sugar sensing transcriptional regulator
MIIHETLKQIGLSDRQTDIYLTLLKQGPGSIRDIASGAGLNRGTTYEELKTLRTRSLVSYFPKGKRKFFCAEPPQQLVKIAEEKQDVLARATSVLRHDILPDLSNLKADSSTINVHHYEGDEGIEFVLKDILKTVEAQPQKKYRVYSSKQIRKYLYRPFPNFTRQRVGKGISVDVIAIGDGGEDAPLAHRKWIQTEAGDTAASYVAIYPPKCALISLVRGDYPTAVLLNSDAIALVMQISFNTLWQRL